VAFACYIIYSKSLDRYYVGYSSDVSERIKLHNTGSFGKKSYTHCASDWELFLAIQCLTIEQAIYVESKIKHMKSRVYIENLRKYPEITDKILKEYSSKHSVSR
jgi:putative endonuclease